MTRRAVTKMLSLGVLAMLAAGCQNDQLNRRITLLEETNRGLATDLNRARGQIDSLQRGRSQLDRRLAAADRNAANLRDELSRVPVMDPVAPGWTAVPGGAMIAIEGSVLFAPGKAVVRKSAQKTLGSVVSALEGEYGDKDILVFGHTDDTPIKKSGWKDNWQLSSERALAVVRYLSSQGVSPSRLVACGCGEHRPRTANSSDAGRGKNRRVEIFAIEPQPQTGRP